MAEEIARINFGSEVVTDEVSFDNTNCFALIAVDIRQRWARDVP